MTEGILDLLRGAYPDNLEVSGPAGGLTTASVVVAVADTAVAGAGPSCEQQLARLEELFSGKMSTLSWTLSAPSARRSSSSNIYGTGGTNMFSTSSSNNIYNAPSKEGLLGSAVLECADCALSDLQIRQLFLGSDTSSASSPSLETWVPVCSVVRYKAVITFLPDAPSAHSVAYPFYGCAGEREGSGSKVRFDIINDAPLGLRLLNTIRLGGKDASCVELVGRGKLVDYAV
jgi:hypothetical protein